MVPRLRIQFKSQKKIRMFVCHPVCRGVDHSFGVFWTSDFFWKTWQMIALSVCALVWRDMKRHLGFERIWKLSFWEKLRIFWKLSWDNLKRNLQLTRGTNALFLGTNLKQKEKLENLLCRLWADRADPTDKDTELSLSPHFGFSLFSLCQV